MFGLLLITHGDLAKGLLSALEMVMGPQKNVQTISLTPEMGSEQLLALINQKINSFVDCKAIFLVSDLFGGTPFNTSLTTLQTQSTSPLFLLTGVNLPMLIQFCSSQTDDPEALQLECLEEGKLGVQQNESVFISGDTTQLF